MNELNQKARFVVSNFEEDGDPCVDPDADFPAAGITVGDWHSRIEVYGVNSYDADQLREFVMEAIALKQRVDSGRAKIVEV